MVGSAHGGQILYPPALGGRFVERFTVPDCVRVIDVARVRVAAASSFPSFLCKHGKNPSSSAISNLNRKNKIANT